MTPRRWGAAWGLTLALLVAPFASAEVRQVEAVGALPLAPDARPTSPPREIAVRLALEEAVRRVALDLLPDLDPDGATDFLPGSLGAEPLDYTTRFRIIEDRGERPALFAEDPNVEFEYVVVVEAHIDAGRVQQRLVDAGLLQRQGGGSPEQDLQLVVEGLRGFAEYDALRRALVEGVGVRSAVPRELERGRAVLAVRTARSARDFLEDLLRAAPPELRVTPLGAADGVLELRVELAAPAQGDLSGEPKTPPGAPVRTD